MIIVSLADHFFRRYFKLANFTVKPNVRLMATLQTPAPSFVFDWQFESSKLQPARANCSFQFEFARASCQGKVAV